MKAILTDIMGTISPVSFIKKLNEDSRDNGAQYIDRAIQSADAGVLEVLEKVKAAAASEGKEIVTGEQAVQHAYEQIVARNLNPAYLALQGMVNADGYNIGRIAGEFFADVPEAFARFKENGKGIYVFSNGSEESQKAMFRTAPQGDISLYVARFFDTAQVGSKTEADSYKRISDAVETAPKEMLFTSDVLQELDAADKAGMAVDLVIRPGNKPVGEHKYKTIQSFSEIDL